MNNYPQSPELGWEALDDCLRIAWKDRTVIATLPPGGILACMHPEWEAEEVEEAKREELRNIAENVILLDDYRR
jgi:hypothetical protein